MPYSLWLTPTGKLGKRLAETIARLAEEHAAPQFEPHVALLGNLMGAEEEVIAQAARLASRLQPYTIQLTSLATSAEFFRCLFVQVKPIEAVMAAHQQARELFHRQGDPPYLPHLSLLYGRYPDHVKEDIITELGDRLQGEFTADSLHLYATGEQTSTWHSVGTYSLR